MSADITPYTDLIPSEHNSKPNFMAVLAAIVQPVADVTAMVESLPDAFDIDNAFGKQLDTVGLWIGRSRYIPYQIADCWFSFDIDGLGWDQANWKGPYDPDEGLTTLDDDHYRTVLKAKVSNNQWDGTLETLYGFMDQVFTSGGYFVIDHCDMSMTCCLAAEPVLDVVKKSLLVERLLDPKPAGVQIRRYVVPSILGSPIFGFGVENDLIAGFGTGAFLEEVSTS